MVKFKKDMKRGLIERLKKDFWDNDIWKERVGGQEMRIQRYHLNNNNIKV